MFCLDSCSYATNLILVLSFLLLMVNFNFFHKEGFHNSGIDPVLLTCLHGQFEILGSALPSVFLYQNASLYNICAPLFRCVVSQQISLCRMLHLYCKLSCIPRVCCAIISGTVGECAHHGAPCAIFP